MPALADQWEHEMVYVIVKADGKQTKALYTDKAAAIAALGKRKEPGSEVVWCKYDREFKMLVATYTTDGVEMYDPMRPKATC